MIQVKHPDESRNRSQEDFLARCPDEDRRYHALMFTYGNIVYRYHQGSTELHLTEEDFQEWLEGLPDDVKPKMKKLGFHRCKSMLSFDTLGAKAPQILAHRTFRTLRYRGQWGLPDP